jgi:hypothetical protein
MSPHSAVLDVRRELEQAIERRLVDLGIGPTKRQLGLGQSIRLLRNAGAIDEHLSKLLDDLRRIGNESAHPSGTDVTPLLAVRYKKLADVAMASLLVAPEPKKAA